MDLMLDQVVLFIISLMANGLSALAGGGAGLLQLPALLFLGLTFSTALATHKIASVALGVGATLRHIKEGGIRWNIALFMLASGLPGVWLGARVVLSWSDEWAKLFLGILTAGLGVYSICSPQLGLIARSIHRTGTGYLMGGLGLFCIGFLNGSLTSGTGLMVTLWMVIWFGFDYQKAVTYTLILVGLFWNGFGAVALALQTTVQWSWLPALLLGAVLGGYAGAHLSIAKGSKLVKRAFEWITILVGGALIAQSMPYFIR